MPRRAIAKAKNSCIDLLQLWQRTNLNSRQQQVILTSKMEMFMEKVLIACIVKFWPKIDYQRNNIYARISCRLYRENSSSGQDIYFIFQELSFVCFAQVLHSYATHLLAAF